MTRELVVPHPGISNWLILHKISPAHLSSAMSQQRRLAAILFTDIVDSTAMMQKDEHSAVSMNMRYMTVLKRAVSSHAGEILNDYGDGSLCAFASATGAVRCAIEMQQQLQTEPKVPLRIGLHIGEIFFEEGKAFGDGVNVASRIQSLGIANSILFSAEINNKLKNQPEFKTVSVGRFHFKNVDEQIEVFALSNEGFIVPDKTKLQGKLQEKKVRRKWILPLAILLLLAVSFLVYQNVFHATRFTEGDKTIAVLPFENRGIRDTDEYISDGITQDIIKNLSKIASLNKVIGWFSVRRFKKTNETLKQVADELGVAAVLSGSMEQHADKIHIIAELTEINTSKRLWGDDFEYDSRDILSIQSKVVGEIVNALKAKVTPQEKNGIAKQYTENVDAYKYYLKGRNFWNHRGMADFDSAEANFKAAIKLDPDYALAYAGLADCYTINQSGNMSQLEAIPIAREFADKALALDSNLSEGYTTLGFIQYNFEYEWENSRKTLERAIELEPGNPTAHLYYGNMLQFSGHTDAGLKEVEKAAELNPLGWAENWVLGRNSYFAGLYDKAISQFKKAIKMAPGQVETTAWSLGLAYFHKKMYQEAREEFDKITFTDHKNPIDYYFAVQSFGYALLGDTIKAKDLLKKSLEEKRKDWVSPYVLSRIYVALGNYPRALDLLEKSYDIRDLHTAYLNVDPELKQIRNEPRFKDLLKKMNLSE